METFVYQERQSEQAWAVSYEVTDRGDYCEIDAVIYCDSLKPNGRKYAYYEGLKSYKDVTNWFESVILGAGIYFDHDDYDQLKAHFLHRKGFAKHIHETKGN